MLHKARTVAIASVVAGCAWSSCMPLGGPPEGQHLIHDRSLVRALFLPSGSSSLPPYLLALGPSRSKPLPASGSSSPYQSAGLDLYQIPYGDGAGPTAELNQRAPGASNVLAASVAPTGPTEVSPPAIDSAGHLFLFADTGEVSPSGNELWQTQRYDPGSGTVEVIGRPDEQYPTLLFSSGRSRVFCEDGLLSGTLVELNGDSSLVQNSPNVAFIGEDFYYSTVATPQGNPAAAESNIYRVETNSSPELLKSMIGYLHFDAIQGDRSPQLLITASTAGANATVSRSLLDTETLAVTSLPANLAQPWFTSASSDGHWLMFDVTSTSQRQFGLFDWTTGASATVSTAELSQPNMVSADWRPGSEELWLSSESDALVWRPGGPSTTIQANLQGLFGEPNLGYSTFTADGRHWFSIEWGPHPSMFAGSADDPTLPPIRLNPEGTSCYSYWPLGGDELLAATYTTDSERQDLYRVNFTSGSSILLTGGGQVVAVGRTRILALLDWQTAFSSGTLTVVDLETGERTPLAEDVTMAAVAPTGSDDPAGDPLAPGTKVAYLFRNRLASPYDGLWLTELP